MSSREQEIRRLRERLCQLERERAAIEDELAEIIAAGPPATLDVGPTPPPTAKEQPFDNRAKVELFRNLFRGRSDVFPLRWENLKTGKSGYAPACANEWKRGLCEKPRIKCSACPNQAFIAATDQVVAHHLRGQGPSGATFVAGVYPVLPDDTCWFLAADFDEAEWRRDVKAFAETCRAWDVPVAIERSRSGNGAHAWIFFGEPVSASLARRLGSALITETLDRAPDIGFASYDRLFPSQDTVPSGGFGNLIALPLQGLARQAGNSVFLDDDLEPYDDQWTYLAGVRRLKRDTLEALVDAASATGRILGVRIPVDDDDEEPWLAPPSRRRAPPAIAGTLPSNLTMVVADQLYIPRGDLPSGLVARLIRLAAFQNPEFYAAQAMRLATHDKPRIVSCAELTANHIGLPRGCFDVAMDLFASLGVTVEIEDRRHRGTAIDISFKGVLRPDQEVAVDALLPHDIGVLAATTAFGKTVVAARMIAERGVNVLVLVHRRQLMDQWVERLGAFLNAAPGMIGKIGGGKRKPSGLIDIALIQSLTRKGEVDDIVGDYGHLIVDECHHLSAVSFELVARRTKARYVLGLSATVTRKDGHHPIIFMQCGPVRKRVDARTEAARRPFDHRVRIRQTAFCLPDSAATVPIQDIYRELAGDEARNDLIFNDVLAALEARRSPVVITERTDHLEALANRLSRFAKNVVVLRGGQSERKRREAMERLAAIPEQDERVIVATGRYLGEGFDDQRLDTLFLTMPIAWRGTLAQYAGRLHRLHDPKREVVIYDYVDRDVPVLARMAAKRAAGYSAIGYTVAQGAGLFDG
ncbi:TOTE conflict system archaeo-eukaryotic primase domain-containing protein [Caulobacter sp. LARHSG274]